jgi:hypothetical protein
MVFKKAAFDHVLKQLITTWTYSKNKAGALPTSFIRGGKSRLILFLFCAAHKKLETKVRLQHRVQT